MYGTLYLEDGTVYKGLGFGKKGISVGELVFNTSITGYEEILTDPSYAGQVINMTYPLIGNYGINDIEKESPKVYARGFIVKSISRNPSNFMSIESIDDMLKNMGVVGIYDVDTRSITKKIRSLGAVKCVISNEELAPEELKGILNKSSLEDNLMNEVSTRKKYHIHGSGPSVALVDFGVKANIINNLKIRGCDITVFPYDASYEDILDSNPSGVLLSNGPGNPKAAGKSIETVKRIIQEKPVFGICMGHQILSLALGADTYKMKYGHRGGNHGVKDIERNRSYITSQNHGYAVDKKSMEGKDIVITHLNLNDNTVEGMKHTKLPVFSVQFHPEGSPGPTDTAYLFDNFMSLMGEYALCR